VVFSDVHPDKNKAKVIAKTLRNGYFFIIIFLNLVLSY
jgi:hypothetical protein